jgi:hypothetical protein
VEGTYRSRNIGHQECRLPYKTELFRAAGIGYGASRVASDIFEHASGKGHRLNTAASNALGQLISSQRPLVPPDLRTLAFAAPSALGADMSAPSLVVGVFV